jgi:hypothetical protein
MSARRVDVQTLVLADGLMPATGAAGLALAIAGELASRLAKRGREPGAPPPFRSRAVRSIRIELSPGAAADGSWLQALVSALEAGKEG